MAFPLPLAKKSNYLKKNIILNTEVKKWYQGLC